MRRLPILDRLRLDMAALNAARERLQGPRGLDWLVTLLAWYLRDHAGRVEPSLVPHAEPLARELARALMAKLARRYASDAERGEAALLHAYPDAATALLAQAMGHVAGVLVADLAANPAEAGEERVARLWPRLTTLPSRQGRSNLGDAFGMVYLLAYDDKLARLRAAGLDAKAWRFDEDGTRVADRRSILAWCFPDAAGKDLDEWARMPPSKIALHVVAERYGVSAARLKALLPRLRRQARALEAALAPARP